MALGTILLILLIIMMLASVPVFPYSREWGFAPFSGIGALLVVVVLLVVLGVIPISVDGTTDGISVDLPDVNLVDDNG